MCLYPTLIKNPKYKSNAKNGGIVPPLSDPRIAYVPIGCQECMECRNKKAREWQLRLQEDIKTHTNGKFVGFTFSNESYTKLSQHEKITNLRGYERDNAIATLAIHYFRERWRKKYGKSIRHFIVTELGHEGTENIHMHGIIWTDVDFNTIEKIWNYGFLLKGKMAKGKLINYVNERSINYIIKYITKKDEKHKYFKSIILTSPGIGHNYSKTTNFKKHKFNHTQTIETYRTTTGHEMAIPIYWRNKAFTETEREQLWIQKLDKQIRWVCKEKINISSPKGMKQFYKVLEFYQEKSRKLGYGNGQKNWEQQQYENAQRNLLHETRKNNNKNSYWPTHSHAQPTHKPIGPTG